MFFTTPGKLQADDIDTVRQATPSNLDVRYDRIPFPIPIVRPQRCKMPQLGLNDAKFWPQGARFPLPGAQFRPNQLGLGSSHSICASHSSVPAQILHLFARLRLSAPPTTDAPLPSFVSGDCRTLCYGPVVD
jgi:hypothetical protein